ncbi:MAG: alpha/beta fold hydrolase [Azoarcus sp.]|jgi:predicted esterase YcpF (UPF0227 family)|nr:alpha/beta fold hydrolase [Azoarcus sp.]
MIFYLHGFRSAPVSWKARALAGKLAARDPDGVSFWCEQLPVSPKAAIALVEKRLAACLAARPAVPPVLVGSSLGGYYATWLAERHDLRAVLVNPAVLAPLSLRQYIGVHENLYTGERIELTAAHIEELCAFETAAITHPERYWLLVETGDEILDYRHAVARYAGVRQTVLEGGGHGFVHWEDYLDEIVRFAGLA